MFIKTERETSILHPDWPEAKWHISGLYNYRVFLRIFINQMNAHKLIPAIASFHGCPDLPWNGGYLNAGVPNTDSAKFFDSLNKNNMGAFLSFTNLAIGKEHLANPEANLILEQLDEKCGLNGVVVVSDLLSEYIRNKKPELKQICSYEKGLFENPQGNIDWYKKMQERFDRVIVFPDHVFDLDLLEKLDRDRTEILVNDECVYRCPTRKRHLNVVSRFNIQRSPKLLEELKDIKQHHCAGEFGIISEKKNPAHVRPGFLRSQELKTIYDMGFRNFRICGRRKSIFGLAWNVTHFVYNPALASIFATVWAHKIDESFKDEFKKLGQRQQQQQQSPQGVPADQADIV
jgi:hypothetical protein